MKNNFSHLVYPYAHSVFSALALSHELRPIRDIKMVIVSPLTSHLRSLVQLCAQIVKNGSIEGVKRPSVDFTSHPATSLHILR
jgi:hypothetical protein